MISDWGKGWEIQEQPVAVQSKPKSMQEGDVGTKSFISLPLDPCHQSSERNMNLIYQVLRVEF